jgi:glycine/D-amino acid oxidase-like deaminating enzyme
MGTGMSSSIDISGLRTQPYWWEAAPREPEAPVTLPATADVVIIGAGYAGLSAGLTLARAGRSVLALDAEAPGFGGSSRSGGMVGHGHRLAYSGLVAAHGKPKAQALIQEGIASLAFVTDLIEREGIDARFRRVGRFRGAATPADYDAQAREAELLTREVGLPVEVVPRAEQRREISSDIYHGGVVFPTHGGLHPALFHQGLLKVARAAGVQVAGHTPATRLRRDGNRFSVETPRGLVEARDVIVATNGYTPNALRPFAQRVVAMPSFLIATERLGTNRVGALVPNGRMLVETAARHLYFRPSPDGERIILGGRAALHPIPLDAAARRLGGLLQKVFPSLDGVRLEHAWTGNVAMTRTSLAGIGQHEGVWYTIGCNGSGVALMPHLGNKVALKLLGHPEGATAFDDLPPPPAPFLMFRPLVQRSLTWWWRAKDALRRG